MSDWEVVTEQPPTQKESMQSDWASVPQEDNQESAWKRIPRDVLIGLTHAGRNLHNLPHDLSKLAEWPAEKIAGPLKNPLSSYLPYDESDYSNVLGQKNPVGSMDKIIQKGIEYAPDIIGGANALRGLKILPHLTRKGASKKLRLAKEKFNNVGTIPENEFIDLYHGKSNDLAQKILKEGLEAPKYSQDYGLLTNNPSTAFEYGSRTSEDIPDILKISIPKNKAHEYLHHENKNWVSDSLKPRGHEESQIFGIKKPIPKEYISAHDYDNLNPEIKDISKLIHDIGSKKIKISPELIDDAEQFLPKTSPYKKMLKEASQGDYNSLFNLQSDLGKHSSDYAKSLFSAAERSHGRAGMATRNKLLSEIHQGLKEAGHEDISNLLKKGQDEYRRYMKFKPYRNAIGVAAGASLLPKNALLDLVKKLAFMKHD